MIVFLFLSGIAFSQGPGLITGNVLDEKKKALEGASVSLMSFQDTLKSRTIVTDGNGSFSFESIGFGWYRLRVSYVGLQALSLDSIHVRSERFDFNLNDVILKSKSESENMEAVIIYAEKPLIQSTDGNITFNAGESALSAGSNASDLLTNVPLVTKDPSGKVLVRGKEPKILIDDKPVELNQQQLQDLLESMPGSSIEKIEVMTNPPPQYANEQGGVINIVTRKGRVGMAGRVTMYGGTRGEAGVNGNFNYRKQGFVLNVNAGGAYNHFTGESYSIRRNIYNDSLNFFNTTSGNNNKNLRPNLRVNADYDINKRNAVSLTLNYNGNGYDNSNFSEYRNINRFEELYRFSNRLVDNSGSARNATANVSYTHKTKRPGETIRFIGGYAASWNESERDYFQVGTSMDRNPKTKDPTQYQDNHNRTSGLNLRLSYDVPLKNRKTFFSLGSYYNTTHSHIKIDAATFRRSDSTWKPLLSQINEFKFHQYVANFRGSVKQVLKENFSVTGGLSAEQTIIRFDLIKTSTDTSNAYWSLLPFATINRNWKDKINLTVSYRRTIRRPGINELNPTVDSVPYVKRFGNPGLIASLADNFDLVLGKTKTKFYVNLGFGYNNVSDIFSQVRIPTTDSTTDVTWQNISGRKEYEMSTWSGYTVSKKLRLNFSASYSYNVYGAFDKEVRNFRNGSSVTSNLNGHYTIRDIYAATTSLTFNRFANPQGTVRSNVSMNIGFQAKLLNKKMTATVNVIDPFVQQKNRSFTYGPNFIQENFSTTQTRNFRLTVSYNISKTPKKIPAKKSKQAPRKPASPSKPTGL
jgi:hypothetical protein